MADRALFAGYPRYKTTKFRRNVCQLKYIVHFIPIAEVLLAKWGWVTYKYISDESLFVTVTRNGDYFLLIALLETIFMESWIKKWRDASIKKVNLIISSAKRKPFCQNWFGWFYFFLNFRYVFLSRSNTIDHISGMVGSNDIKQKCIGGILGQLCNLDILLHQWPWP